MTMPPESVASNKVLSNAHASLWVYDDVNPVFWTEYFGVQPDMFSVKGERSRTPSGRIRSTPARVGLWGCRSKSAAQSGTLDPHIEYLIDLLRLPRSDLPELLRKREASMRVFCDWHSEQHEPPFIDSRLEKIVNDSGGTIEVDQYSKPDLEGEPEEP